MYELLQAGIPYNKKPLRHLEKVGTPNNNYPNVWGKHKNYLLFPYCRCFTSKGRGRKSSKQTDEVSTIRIKVQPTDMEIYIVVALN